jgi:hypothetical protein
MADHLQQQILDAVHTNLLGAATAAGSNVFMDRVDDLMPFNLPAIHIEGAGEDATPDSLSFPTVYNRVYRFTVACVCGQESNPGKVARNLAKQVEAAILASTSTATAGGLAKMLTFTGSTEAKDGNGATSFFEVRQTWQAQYMTLGGAPDTPI